MNFTQKADSIFLVGTTEKGNTISFVPVSEEKSIISDNNQITTERKKEFIKKAEVKRIVFYCNFYITQEMIDELEKSKIIKIVELSNEKKQIIAYPVASFDYSKIQDILLNFCQKFNL